VVDLGLRARLDARELVLEVPVVRVDVVRVVAERDGQDLAHRAVRVRVRRRRRWRWRWLRWRWLRRCCGAAA
jgi:hypothetical protein